MLQVGQLIEIKSAVLIVMSRSWLCALSPLSPLPFDALGFLSTRAAFAWGETGISLVLLGLWGRDCLENFPRNVLEKKLIMDVCGAVECSLVIKGGGIFVIFELIYEKEVNLM